MKRLLTITFALCIALGALAQKPPKRADILRAMHTANDYFIRKYPDPTVPTFVKKERPSNLWTRGVYFEGLMELIKLDRREQNVDYVRRWADFHKWTPRNGVLTRDADDYCCSQTYIDFATGGYCPDLQLADMLRPTIQCMDNLLHPAAQELSPKSKAKYNDNSLHDWTWIDAIQMGLPVLTSLAEAPGTSREKETAYCEQGWRMYVWARDTLAGGLFNKKEGLWWRDKDFVPPYKEPNGANCYWSRGNGWVYAALVRAMEDLENNPRRTQLHYDGYKADFLLMSEALLKCQRKDRFWNVSLHDESNFGGKELTGTALFVYGMAWGINHGLLDAKTYRPVVIKTWKAMVKNCLRKDGFLHYVQGTGKEPKDSQPVGLNIEPDFDDYGLGCFLLAGCEVEKLSK